MMDNANEWEQSEDAQKKIEEMMEAFGVGQMPVPDAIQNLSLVLRFHSIAITQLLTVLGDRYGAEVIENIYQVWWKEISSSVNDEINKQANLANTEVGKTSVAIFGDVETVRMRTMKRLKPVRTALRDLCTTIIDSIKGGPYQDEGK